MNGGMIWAVEAEQRRFMEYGSKGYGRNAASKFGLEVLARLGRLS